jgi:hypothetical protein
LDPRFRKISIRLTGSSSTGAVNEFAVETQICSELAALISRDPSTCTFSGITTSLTSSLTVVVNVDIELRTLNVTADRDQLLELLAYQGISIGGFVMIGSATSTTLVAGTLPPTPDNTTADPFSTPDPAQSSVDDDDGPAMNMGLVALVAVSLCLIVGTIMVTRQRSSRSVRRGLAVPGEKVDNPMFIDPKLDHARLDHVSDSETSSI